MSFCCRPVNTINFRTLVNPLPRFFQAASIIGPYNSRSSSSLSETEHFKCNYFWFVTCCTFRPHRRRRIWSRWFCQPHLVYCSEVSIAVKDLCWIAKPITNMILILAKKLRLCVDDNQCVSKCKT